MAAWAWPALPLALSSAMASAWLPVVPVRPVSRPITLLELMPEMTALEVAALYRPTSMASSAASRNTLLWRGARRRLPRRSFGGPVVSVVAGVRVLQPFEQFCVLGQGTVRTVVDPCTMAVVTPSPPSRMRDPVRSRLTHAASSTVSTADSACASTSSPSVASITPATLRRPRDRVAW